MTSLQPVWRCMRVACLGSVICLPMAVHGSEWEHPQPFRRQALEGRQFSYNAESFLHRLSFEAQPRLLQDRRLTGSGIEGTAGSTRGDELYVRSHLRLQTELDQRWFAEASHRRSEDFDGRFDTFLAGAGIRHHQWQAALLADLEGAKENVDLHLRLGWHSHDEHHFLRLSIVGSDYPFNDKQDDGSYERQPFTMHVYGESQPWSVLHLRGFVNWNAPMRLEWSESGMRSDDEGIAAGLSGILSISDQWQAALSIEGRYRLRESRIYDPPDDPSLPDYPEQRLRRSHLATSLEAGYRHDDGAHSWVGMRAFSLRETDRRDSDDPHGEFIDRQEFTLYGGHRRPLRGHWWIAPSMFLAYHDNEIERPHADPDDDELAQRERHVGFYGKFSPTFEYRVLDDRRGVISFIPHMRLHRAAFGGGNIQVYLPF